MEEVMAKGIIGKPKDNRLPLKRGLVKVTFKDKMMTASSKEIPSDPALKSLKTSTRSLESLVTDGLQKLGKFCGELINQADIDSLSTELNQLGWIIKTRPLSSKESCDAADLVHDAEDSIYKRCQRFGGEEYLFASKKSMLWFELRRLTTKIRDFNGHLLGSRKFLLLPPRQGGHQGGSSDDLDCLPPVVIDKEMMDLQQFWKYEIDSLVGLEDTKEKIISLLLDGEREFKIVCICGMQGIGKTTLAKSVYQEISVRRHFDCFAWIRIGDRFSSRRVLEDFLVSVTCHKWEEMISYTDSDLAELVYDFLQQRSCLVVLDDVWTLDVWDCLSIIFPTSEETGSRLLLTTPGNEVADKIAASSGRVLIHQMRGLGQQQCVDLLLMTAFRAQRPVPEEELELSKVARRIVQNCSGLPLMVKLVGGVLASKQMSKHEWEMVNQKIVLSQETDQDSDSLNNVTSILNLAYDSLPDFLKQCFLYMAMFPKGVEVEAEWLYLLWLAEGFIEPSTDPSRKQSTMDDAEWYLCELCIRVMVLVHKPEVPNGMWFKSFHLHDMMHDLCLLKRKESNFCVDLHSGRADDGNLRLSSLPVAARGISRLGLYLEHGSLVPHVCNTVKSLGSFAISTASHNQQQFISLHKLSDLGDISNLTRLYFHAFNHRLKLPSLNSLARSFDLGDLKRPKSMDCYGFNFDAVRWNAGMGKLRELRHLSLRNCNIESLPSAISTLTNLQTLYLPECTRSEMVIPSKLRNLSSLRFLYLPCNFVISGGGKLQMSWLRNLEVLVNFDSALCEVKDLCKLTKLKKLVATIDGDLLGLAELSRNVEARLNCLVFSSLHVRTFNCYSKENHSVFEDLWRWPNLCVLRLEGIMGNLPMWILRGLNELSLYGSALDEDPMEKLEKLPNLFVLKLCNNAVLGKSLTCSVFGMPQLRHLTLSNLENLEKFAVEKGGLPNLSTMTFERCKRLKRPPDCLSCLTSLQELIVLCMPSVFVECLDKAGNDLTRDKHAYIIKTNQLF